jgi:hypothetical protein
MRRQLRPRFNETARRAGAHEQQVGIPRVLLDHVHGRLRHEARREALPSMATVSCSNSHGAMVTPARCP